MYQRDRSTTGTELTRHWFISGVTKCMRRSPAEGRTDIDPPTQVSCDAKSKRQRRGEVEGNIRQNINAHTHLRERFNLTLHFIHNLFHVCSKNRALSQLKYTYVITPGINTGNVRE